ncbi:MAG: hypothetical protein AB7E32_02520 [Desulfovibrio sp.]
MYRQYCDICHQPIESMDFHLRIKGGCICPACVPLVRSVALEDSQYFDNQEMPLREAGLPRLPDATRWDEPFRIPVRVLTPHRSKAMPRPALRPMFS